MKLFEMVWSSIWKVVVVYSVGEILEEIIQS